MNNKVRLIISLLVITVICFVDYQYFSEGMDVRKMNPTTRQVGHLIVLMVITTIGYVYWKKHPLVWTGKLWLVSYIIAIDLLIIIGLIQWRTGYFGKEFLDRVSDARLFFGSPLPFLMLYLLTKLSAPRDN